MSHQQYTTTLKQAVGQILSHKPNLPPTIATQFINDAVRLIVDRKPNWSGLTKNTVLYLPDEYTTGSISFTQDSTTVTGTSTSWPITDVVNTTVVNPVYRQGLQTITPSSMTGIDVDTLLYVDATGNPEVVAVKSVTDQSFQADFRYAHNANFTLTCSSLAGLQLKTSINYPIYTVKAVVSTTSLIIDNAWKSANQASSYSIRRMYCTIDPSVKTLISVMDQAQGIPPLAFDKPIQWLNFTDPQRSATGYPRVLATKGPDANGNMQYEIWPASQTERQLRVVFTEQPAMLLNDGDFLPFFLNPSVIIYFAIAMAWNTKISADDQWFDPANSTRWMRQFEDMYGTMCIADDQKASTDFQSNQAGMCGYGGANWAQSHDWDSMIGNV